MPRLRQDWVHRLMFEIVKEPAEEINRLYIEIGEFALPVQERALRIGQLLSEQRKSLKRGQFLSWLETSIKVPRPTAYRWMKMYRDRDEFLKMRNLAEGYRIDFPKQSRNQRPKQAKELSREEAHQK